MDVQKPCDDIILDPSSFAQLKDKEEDKVTPELTTPLEPTEDEEGGGPTAQVNRKRCYSCTKKVGLTGLECRCGFVFCGKHRYPECHECTFDHKANDRSVLAKTLVGGGQFTKVQKL